MTIKQLKVVLKDLKLLRGGQKGTKKKDSKKAFELDRWLLISSELEGGVNSSFLFGFSA